MPLICHTLLIRKFFCEFEKKDIPFRMEGVSFVSYELWYIFDIDGNYILMEHGQKQYC